MWSFLYLALKWTANQLILELSLGSIKAKLQGLFKQYCDLKAEKWHQNHLWHLQFLPTLRLAYMYWPKSCSIIYLNCKNKNLSFIGRKIWFNTFSSSMNSRLKIDVIQRIEDYWSKTTSFHRVCKLKRTDTFYFCRMWTSSPQRIATGRKHSASHSRGKMCLSNYVSLSVKPRPSTKQYQK